MGACFVVKQFRFSDDLDAPALNLMLGRATSSDEYLIALPCSSKKVSRTLIPIRINKLFTTAVMKNNYTKITSHNQ
jgi:hypothetical protein